MAHNIGSIVQLSNDEIRVFVDTDSDDNKVKSMGAVLLISEYTLRLMGTVRNDQRSLNLLRDVLSDVASIDNCIQQLVANYEKLYRLNSIEVVRGGIRENKKRELYFAIQYSADGNFFPTFRPRGFGILGRNIEMASVLSCLVTIKYILDKYDDFLIKNTLDLLREKLMKVSSVNIEQELRIAKEVFSEQFKDR